MAERLALLLIAASLIGWLIMATLMDCSLVDRPFNCRQYVAVTGIPGATLLFFLFFRSYEP